MQKGQHLHFDCIECLQPIEFSIFDIEGKKPLACTQCSKKYSFDDEHLLRQLRKFESLCKQLVDSEEILSNTAIGVDVGDHHVKIPYRLLLTRFTSSLALNLGDKPLTIDFRFEPNKDLPMGQHITKSTQRGQV